MDLGYTFIHSTFVRMWHIKLKIIANRDDCFILIIMLHSITFITSRTLIVSPFPFTNEDKDSEITQPA